MALTLGVGAAATVDGATGTSATGLLASFAVDPSATRPGATVATMGATAGATGAEVTGSGNVPKRTLGAADATHGAAVFCDAGGRDEATPTGTLPPDAEVTGAPCIEEFAPVAEVVEAAAQVPVARGGTAAGAAKVVGVAGAGLAATKLEGVEANATGACVEGVRPELVANVADAGGRDTLLTNVVAAGGLTPGADAAAPALMPLARTGVGADLVVGVTRAAAARAAGGAAAATATGCRRRSRSCSRRMRR